MFHQSQIMNISTPGDGAVLALTCMCEGITPLEFAKTYHIISGKPSMRADMMAAKFRAAGGKCNWINLGDDGKLAEALFAFDGQEHTIKYTIEDADRVMGADPKGGRRIDKDDSNWRKDRGAMLRARLITKAIRIMAPELIAGVYTPDELEDFGQADQQPAKPARKSREDRAKELAGESVVVVTNNDIATATVVDDVIDVEPEPNAATVETPPIEASEPTAAQEDDGELPTTPELNQEILALGKKIPNKDNPGTPYTLPEIAAIICTACKVDAVPKATRYQIRTLIERWRNALGGK
jgi:hypothetical protein